MSKTHAPHIGMVIENWKCCFYALFISLHWKVFSNEKLFLPNLVAKFLICKPVNEKALLTHAVKIPTFHQNANG